MLFFKIRLNIFQFLKIDGVFWKKIKVSVLDEFVIATLENKKHSEKTIINLFSS